MAVVSVARGLRVRCTNLLYSSLGRQITGGSYSQPCRLFEVSPRRNISQSCVNYASRDGPKYSVAQLGSKVEDKSEYRSDGAELTLDRTYSQRNTSCSHITDEGAKFSDFPLEEKVLNRLQELGYDQPFDIQKATLQHTLNDRDVIARALTGSGKTLAFSIPIVHKLCQRQSRRTNSPKAIVISPTRELCLQIHKSIQELDGRLKCVAIYGGASINRQERELQRGVDVVCATPGRLNDHVTRGNLGLNELEFLCLDEADELFTPGFKEQIENVLVSSPGDKQVMLFSATMPPEIKAVTYQYMKDPVEVDITINQKYKAPESVTHQCMQVPADQHLMMVHNLVKEHQPERCIVFMETKKSTHRATTALQRMGLRAEGISSDLSQNQREAIMAVFRSGQSKILVATDVAARGLDIPEVDLVIQVGPPRNGSEYYLHRSGRTGRAGRDGLAIMLHTGDSRDRQTIREIHRVVKLEHVKPPGYEKIMEASAEKIIDNLQKSNSRGVEMIRPVVERLELSDEQRDGLLVAAIAAMMKGPEERSSPDHTTQRHQSGYGQSPRHYGQQRYNRSSRNWGRDDYGFQRHRDDYGVQRHRDDYGVQRQRDDYGVQRHRDDYGVQRQRDDYRVQERRGNYKYKSSGKSRGLQDWDDDDNDDSGDEEWDSKPSAGWTSR